MPEVAESSRESLERESESAPLSVRLSAFAAISLPLLGVIAAPFFVWGWGFGWVDLGLLIGMYVASAIGITVGFHR